MEIKENVVNISWDRNNNRFGVVYEIAGAVKSDHVQFGVGFYQINTSKDKKTQTVQKICEIKTTPANRLILSQNGNYFALYNISIESSGRYKFTLGYFGKDQKTKKPTVEIVKENIEISYMKFFEMDASGRFIILGTDKAYYIWSMTGELIYKDIFTCPIFNVHFRPRYLTHLSVEEEKKMLDREKEIKKKYEEEDEKRLNVLKYEKERLKKEQRAKFKEYLANKRQWFATFKEKRDQIRGFKEEDPKVKSEKYEYLVRENN